MRVGFIGLGIMGLPMAGNLVRAGFDVTGYNRSESKTHRLVEAGGQAASSAVDAVRDADVVITMLPDGPDVEAVLLTDDGGVFSACRPGALCIDMSTIRPETARYLAQEGSRRSVRVLDAPVSGGEQGAVEGALSVMVGGAADDFEAARGVLDALGTTVIHVGPAGSGQTVKAANQLVVAGTIGLVAEAIVFLEAHGVQTQPALEVLGGGLAGSAVLERKGAAMVGRRFDPGFRVDLHHKDLGIVLSAAEQAGVVMPLAALTAQLMASLKAQGHGELDHSALLKVVEQLNGRAPR